MELDEKVVDIIREIVHNGNRVEIVPAKDGIDIFVAKRHKYKPNKNPGSKSEDSSSV